jgi:hypothetical protein
MTLRESLRVEQGKGYSVRLVKSDALGLKNQEPQFIAVTFIRTSLLMMRAIWFEKHVSSSCSSDCMRAIACRDECRARNK